MENSNSLHFDRLTQRQINKLKDAFQLIDEDGDGNIGRSDMVKMLASLGQKVTTDDVGKMFKELRDENDAYISFPEFLALMSESICEFPQEDELKECFGIISQNKDLDLPTDKLIRLLEEAGFKNPEEEFKRILATFSANQQLDGSRNFKSNQFIDSLND